jgi:hypothetical protein
VPCSWTRVEGGHHDREPDQQVLPDLPGLPGRRHDLVWSLTDSQDHLLALINGATNSLRIYSEEMGDTTVENALIRAAKHP